MWSKIGGKILAEIRYAEEIRSVRNSLLQIVEKNVRVDSTPDGRSVRSDMRQRQQAETLQLEGTYAMMV